MKRTFIAIGIASLLAAPVYAGEPSKEVMESRAAIKQLGGTLKGELQAAMKKGGPTEAIKVCNTVAPAIAADISEKNGFDVARTSLKPRNAGNAPDAWETKVLQSFEDRKAAGENPGKMEFSEVVDMNGKKTFRYMKAIPTGKVCLNCHGTEIKPGVLEQVNAMYPEDKAIGFKEGDIRGAFTIIREM
jgi:hypothetical protein